MAHEGAPHALVIAGGKIPKGAAVLASGGGSDRAIKVGASGGPSGQATIRSGVGRQLLD